MKFTSAKKKKIERIFEDLGYSIRYEKGRFNSGHCVVHRDKIVIINRFFDTEGRARVLLDILLSLKNLDEKKLSKDSKVFFNSLVRQPQ